MRQTILFFIPCQKQTLSLINAVAWLNKLKEVYGKSLFQANHGGD
jgi:hypothetical protein